ncbi:MAG: TIGR03936 family radical SAM-associated protein [Clostridiales bacterium]|nr:TIGR03936 family radical SAM-associated protein [Clostridiales bacterium]MCC8059354.1 TIGR03936 family radical SAM-associated protein [Clostridiales bacterium]
MKIRIRFTKTGDMRFIGHLDMMRFFQKVMRRAGVDICYSGGFSPHQIMSFAAPLGVGLTSHAEYVDIEVHSTESSSVMIDRINASLTEQVQVVSYRRLADDTPAAMSCVAAADYTIGPRSVEYRTEWPQIVAGIPGFLAQDVIPVTKQTKKGERTIDIRPLIYRMETEDDEDGYSAIRLQAAAGSVDNLKPGLVMDTLRGYLGLEPAPFATQICREEVYALSGRETPRFVSLESLGEDIE